MQIERIDRNQLAVGEMVLAFDEHENKVGYYPVTATWVHEDPLIVTVTIDGERIETTPGHPFYVEGEWIFARDLWVGASVTNGNSGSGTIQQIEILPQTKMMYNLTVGEAHTYYVGSGQWLVHNAGDCPIDPNKKPSPTVIRYADEAVSGLTPRLQDAIIRAIRDNGDPNALYAFRGRAPESSILDGVVPQKPAGAENLWEGPCGLRYCKVPDPKGGDPTYGYYVSDLDPAWAVSGQGKRILDEELLKEDGIYQKISEYYKTDNAIQDDSRIHNVIQHGAHLNAVLDGIDDIPLGPERYDKYFQKVTDPTDPVYIFGVDGYIGSGLLGTTYNDALKGRIKP